MTPAPGPQNKPENKFYFPGFNIGGPLLIPGTDFNKSRDKLFFFFGYEYYKQDLDTGTLRSWVPTQAMRNGDFATRRICDRWAAAACAAQPFASNGGQVPASEIDPNGRILLNLLPLPEHQPGAGQRLQLRAERAAQPGQPSGPRPRGPQPERQHEDVLPLQLPGRTAAVSGWSLVAQ